jgi:hypothetical protein
VEGETRTISPAGTRSPSSERDRRPHHSSGSAPGTPAAASRASSAAAQCRSARGWTGVDHGRSELGHQRGQRQWSPERSRQHAGPCGDTSTSAWPSSAVSAVSGAPSSERNRLGCSSPPLPVVLGSTAVTSRLRRARVVGYVEQPTLLVEQCRPPGPRHPRAPTALPGRRRCRQAAPSPARCRATAGPAKRPPGPRRSPPHPTPNPWRRGGQHPYCLAAVGCGSKGVSGQLLVQQDGRGTPRPGHPVAGR